MDGKTRNFFDSKMKGGGRTKRFFEGLPARSYFREPNISNKYLIFLAVLVKNTVVSGVEETILGVMISSKIDCI